MNRSPPVLGSALFAAFAFLAASGLAAAASSGSPPPAAVQGPRPSPAGIGFLFTPQSETVVGRLQSDRDFVDVILGPGRMDIFRKVQPPQRVVCIALALEKHAGRPFPGLKETIDLLRTARVPPGRVILAYNPENQPGTTQAELKNLVESTRKAKQMAADFGAPLLVGPGLREMIRREDLYPELAKSCDIWLIQSQRLQLDETTRKPVSVETYRAGVKRIVDRLREGNPKIRVFVQLVTTAERGTVVQDASEIAAFVRSIEDMVEAVRIYGAPVDRLNQIIDELRGPARPGVIRSTEPAATKAGGGDSPAAPPRSR